MAQLRWDQVAAPNLNGGITGIESANKMIGGGLENMATALGQFGDRQALEQLSRYNDAQKLQQDLQAGTFNTGNASAEALKTIMGRPNDLIRNAYTQQAIDHNAEMNPLNLQYKQLEIDDKLVMDPLNQQFKQLQVQGSQMDLANQEIMDPLRQADAQLRTHQGYSNHYRSEEERALGLAMGQQWAVYKRDNLMTPDAAQAFLEQFKDNPVAFKMASELIAKEVQGFGQAIVAPSPGSIPGATVPATGATAGATAGVPTTTGGVPGAGGTVPVAGAVPTTSPEGTAGTYKGSPFDVVYGYGKYGVPPKPLTDSSLKEVIDFGKNVLIPNTKGTLPNQPKDLGTSASGRYQITQKTLTNYGPKVFGDDWENVKFSPENQDKLGEAIFNDSKNGNLKAIWEGAPDATPGAYKDLTWDQFKSQVIDRFESPTASSGQQPTALTPGQQATAFSNMVAQDNTTSSQLLQAANMFSDTGLMNAAAAAYKKDPEGLVSSQAVATQMTGEGGSLRGIGVNNVLSAIEDVKTKLGVSASVAGTIVERAISAGYFGLSSTEQKVDRDKLENLLDTIGGKRNKDGIYENRNKVSTVLDALAKGTASENARNKLDTTKKEIAEIAAEIKQLEGMGSSRAVQQGIAAANARLALARSRQQEALAGTGSAVQGLVGDLTPPPAPPLVPPSAPPAPVATKPATPVGTVSSGSGNPNAVRGLDYSAAQQYWQNQNQQNAKAREEQSLAEAARKAKEAKEDMDRRISAAKRMKEMFPETNFLAY